MQQAPKNIYIYGSCVARDTATAMGSEAATIVGYTARHSILSEGTDASYKLPDDLGLTSAFQTRMVRQDWAGNPLDQLFAQADTLDLLLWDLMDERIGVHWFLTGEIITRSVDLMRSEAALDVLEPNTRIPFGTDTHYEGWAEKTTEFVQKLKETGLLPKTRLIKIDWAETTPDGTKTPYSMGLSPAKANKLYSRYYQHLQNLGVPTIEVPQSITTADPNHQWGLAPFHYTKGVYQYIIDHLDTPTIQGQAQPYQEQIQPKPALYTTTLSQLEALTTPELVAIGHALDCSAQTYLSDALYQALVTSWNISHPGQNLDNLTPESLWLTHIIATELSGIPWRQVFFFRGHLPVFELTWNQKILATDVVIEPEREGYSLTVRIFLRGNKLIPVAKDLLQQELIQVYTQQNPDELILATTTDSLETAYHEAKNFMDSALAPFQQVQSSKED